MKKIIAILLACILSLSLLAGCDEKETEEAAAAEKGQQTASAEDRPRVPPESVVGAELQSESESKKTSKDGEKSGAKPEGETAAKQEESKGESAVTLSGEKPGKQGEKGEKKEKTEKSEGENTEKKSGEDKQDSGEKSEENGEKKGKNGKKGKWGKNGKKGKKGKNGKNGKRGSRKKKGDDQNAPEAAPETASEATAELAAEDAENEAPQDRSAMRMMDMRPDAAYGDEPVAALLSTDTEPEKVGSVVNLEGAWEPRNSVGPRVEISGSRLIRLWNGSPVLATSFTLKQDGESFILELADKELRYAPGQEPYATVKSCVYEDGEITITDDFPITGESSETLYPTRNSRYGNVTDVSYETLPMLAGRWEQEGGDAVLEFSGNSMSFGSGNHVDGTVHVIVVRSNRERREDNEEEAERRDPPAQEETAQAAPERSETEGESSGENNGEGRRAGRRNGNRNGRRNGNRMRNRGANGGNPERAASRARSGGRGGAIRIVDIDPGVKTVGSFSSLTVQGDTIVGTVNVADGDALQVTFRRAPMAPGGSTDYSNYNAATTISSTEITDFRCTISLLSVYLPDETQLTSPRYELSAQRSGDTVTCRRASYSGDESFTQGADFLEKVQAVVARYNLAQFNGHDVVTHGLPEDFGATISVTYASGEKLSAADNQNMYLPLEAVRDLVMLFYSVS